MDAKEERGERDKTKAEVHRKITEMYILQY